MEETNKVEKLLSDLKHYAETRFDLVVLNLQDKVSGVLSSVASIAIIGVLGVFILLFTSLGAAFWLGEYFRSTSIGFFCIAGFYLVIALLIFLNREVWVKSPIINSLLKKINYHGHN